MSICIWISAIFILLGMTCVMTGAITREGRQYEIFYLLLGASFIILSIVFLVLYEIYY